MPNSNNTIIPDDLITTINDFKKSKDSKKKGITEWEKLNTLDC